MVDGIRGKTILDVRCGWGTWAILFKVFGAEEVHTIEVEERLYGVSALRLVAREPVMGRQSSTS